MFWGGLMAIAFYLCSGFSIIGMDLDESFKISPQEEEWQEKSNELAISPTKSCSPSDQS